MTTTPGRYLLDAAGTLHDIPPRRLVSLPIVAAVTVRLKPNHDLLSRAPLSDAETEDALAEFRDRMDAAARRRRAGKVPAEQRPPVDVARLANAFRAKAGKSSRRKAPAERAQRPNDCCPHCGARGAAGCDHFLPCSPETGL